MGFWEKVFDVMKNVYEESKRSFKHYMKKAPLVVTAVFYVVSIFFIGSWDGEIVKFYFLLTILFSIIIYYVIKKMMNYTYLFEVNMDKWELGVYEMSQKALNGYKFTDHSGLAQQPSMMFKTKHGVALVCDNVNVRRRMALVNQINNIDYFNDYQRVSMERDAKLQQIINELQILKAKTRYEALLKSVELLERVSVVDKLSIPLNGDKKTAGELLKNLEMEYEE